MTEAANSNDTHWLEVEVVPLMNDPTQWLVEAIDHQSEGEIYRTIFQGPDAEKRARTYAAALSATPSSVNAGLLEAAKNALKYVDRPADYATLASAISAAEVAPAAPGASWTEEGLTRWEEVARMVDPAGWARTDHDLALFPRQSPEWREKCKHEWNSSSFHRARRILELLAPDRVRFPADLATLNATPPATSEPADEAVRSALGKLAEYSSGRDGYVFRLATEALAALSRGEAEEAPRCKWCGDTKVTPNCDPETAEAWEDPCPSCHDATHQGEAGAPSREAMVLILSDFLKARDEALGPVGPEHTEEERLESARELLDILSERPAAEGWRPTHRHVKRGTEYRMLSHAVMQTAEPVSDYAAITVYQGSDGAIWARPTAEFDDGRFEPLPASPAPAETKEGGAG